MKPLSLINDKPLIWAHRGGRSLGPENTLQALRRGHEAGADGWETDVQLTKDGELIILHDLNLLRTTNAGVHPLFKANRPALPWRFTLEEIKKLSANVFPRRFCPPHYSEQPWKELPETVHPDLRVPTLSEALDLTAELGMWINIEIKDLSHDVPEKFSKMVVKKVTDMVHAKGMDTQVIISSFNHDYMRESKVIAPQIFTGILTPHEFKGDPVEAAKAVNADAWHPGFQFLTAEVIQRVREAGIAINPYTVNKPEDVSRLTKWGVTGLVTDCPQSVR